MIEIGYVARAHGVSGELRVVTHNPESTTLDTAVAVHIGGVAFDIVSTRAVTGAYLLRVTGVSDRERAEQLKGKPVEVDRELVALDDGEVILSELIGFEVHLPDGSSFGKVANIDAGPQDRLVIHHGDIERLLPYVPEFIVSVDLDEGTIVVDPPEGLPQSKR